MGSGYIIAVSVAQRLHNGEAGNRAVYRFSDIGKHFGWTFAGKQTPLISDPTPGTAN
jgi:hypothetical protein